MEPPAQFTTLVPMKQPCAPPAGHNFIDSRPKSAPVSQAANSDPFGRPIRPNHNHSGSLDRMPASSSNSFVRFGDSLGNYNQTFLSIQQQMPQLDINCGTQIVTIGPDTDGIVAEPVLPNPMASDAAATPQPLQRATGGKKPILFKDKYGRERMTTWKNPSLETYYHRDKGIANQFRKEEARKKRIEAETKGEGIARRAKAAQVKADYRRRMKEQKATALDGPKQHLKGNRTKRQTRSGH